MAASTNTRFQPDFVIAWLDANMGKSGNNVSSRNDLASNVDLNSVSANDRFHDIDNLIGRIDANVGNDNEESNNLIRNVLQMFIETDSCITFINKNLEENRKVFLIVSGQLGESIVDQMHMKLSGDIYVFCGRRDVHEWTDNYLNHLEVFDDETGVFAKVLADIGIHYLKKHYDDTCNAIDAIKYLRWARQFFTRASKLDKVKRQDYLDMVDDALQTRQNAQPNNIDLDDEMNYIAQDAMD